MHNDHVGLIKYIKKGNIQVLTHRVAEERQREQIRIYKDMYRNTSEELQLMGGGSFQQFLSRFEHSFREDPKPIRIDRLLEDDDTIDLPNAKLKVIWTPGHAPEHICLHDAQRHLLFSGDHILPEDHKPRKPTHLGETRPPQRLHQQPKQGKNLPVALILPGHEKNFKNLPERIEQIQKHHEARLNEIKNAIKNGKNTIFDIAAAIHWDSRPWSIMDFWTKRMAAAETYAHIIYLRNKGDINETKKENALNYKQA